MVGIIYLTTVTIVGLLLAIAQRQHHGTTESSDLFRFPSVLVWALRVGVFVFPLIGWGVYATFRQPDLLDKSFLTTFFGIMTICVAISCMSTQQFLLEVFDDRLKLHEVFRRNRTIGFASIAEIVIRWPWRGRGYLKLLDHNGLLLAKLDGGIQNFDELVYLIETRSPSNVAIREHRWQTGWTKR